MQRRPKISVVLTCYKIEHKLDLFKQALQSVLEQSEQDFEIIIVDDCSPDQTQRVINDYLAKLNLDQTIHYHRLAKNSGTSVARNEGIAKCSAEIISILDYDDLYLPRHLETILSAFEKDSETLLALAGTYFYNSFAGAEKASSNGKCATTLNNMSIEELFAYCLKNNFPVAMGSGVSCRRELFSKYPQMYFDEFLSKKTAEDILFGFQALALGIRPYFIEELQVIHRSYYKGTSRSSSAFANCNELEVYDYIYQHAGSSVYHIIKSSREDLTEAIDLGYKKTRLNFRLKNYFLNNEFLESIKLVTNNPSLKKSWLRFCLLKLSRHFPFNFLRDVYLYWSMPSDDKSTKVVCDFLADISAKTK